VLRVRQGDAILRNEPHLFACGDGAQAEMRRAELAEARHDEERVAHRRCARCSNTERPVGRGVQPGAERKRPVGLEQTAGVAHLAELLTERDLRRLARGLGRDLDAVQERRVLFGGRAPLAQDEREVGRGHGQRLGMRPGNWLEMTSHRHTLRSSHATLSKSQWPTGHNAVGPNACSSHLTAPSEASGAAGGTEAALRVGARERPEGRRPRCAQAAAAGDATDPCGRAGEVQDHAPNPECSSTTW